MDGRSRPNGLAVFRLMTVVFVRLLDGKVGRFVPLENLVDIDGSASGQVIEVCRLKPGPRSYSVSLP
jgi:hypothetical protein